MSIDKVNDCWFSQIDNRMSYVTKMYHFLLLLSSFTILSCACRLMEWCLILALNYVHHNTPHQFIYIYILGTRRFAGQLLVGTFHRMPIHMHYLLLFPHRSDHFAFI